MVLILLIALAAGILVPIATWAFAWWNANAALTAPPATPGPEPEPQHVVLEGEWYKNYPNARTLPVDALIAIADPTELAAASMHHERLHGITGRYFNEGPSHPLTVNIDRHGRACLADGHHRLIVAPRTGYQNLPVQFELVDRIRGYGQPAVPFLLSAALSL